jgi:hypothetical protein
MGPLKGLPLGFEQLTLTGTAQQLTVPAGATFAIMRVSTADASWRDDGTAPTASIGFSLLHTDVVPFEYWGDLGAFEAIAVSGSPVLNVSYYKAVG